MLTTPLLIMVSVVNRAGCPVYHNEFGFGIDYTDREVATASISTVLRNTETLPVRNLSSVPKDYFTDFNTKLKAYDFEKAIAEGWNRAIESPGEHVVKIQIGNLDIILEYVYTPEENIRGSAADIDNEVFAKPMNKGFH